MPMHCRPFKLANVGDIPNEESGMILLRDVLHGQVMREVYVSKAMNSRERCLVYLPPQYRKGVDYSFGALSAAWRDGE